MEATLQPSGRKGHRHGAGLARLLGIPGAILLAAIAGFGLGLARNNSSHLMAVEELVPLDYYLAEQSFSEVENTKARLAALATQFLTELRVRHNATAATPTTEGGNPLYAVNTGSAIEELRAGIDEFKGTEQEMALVRELLCLLKKEGFTSRWLDTYLRALYVHATHPMLGRCDKDAVAISDALGRQAELAQAFYLLERNPFEYECKARFRADTPQLTELAAPEGGSFLLSWVNAYRKAPGE
jgi:hypothetical protein